MWRDLLFKTSVADCFLFMEKPIDSEIVRRILERHQSALDDILADELPPDLDKEKRPLLFFGIPFIGLRV